MRKLVLVAGLAMAIVAGCSKASSVPPCPSAEVTNFLAELLADAAANKLRGVTLNEIRIKHPAETRFQKSPPKRFCRAELETELGREPLYYSIEWQQKENAIMWIQILETENGE